MGMKLEKLQLPTPLALDGPPTTQPRSSTSKELRMLPPPSRRDTGQRPRTGQTPTQRPRRRRRPPRKPPRRLKPPPQRPVHAVLRTNATPPSPRSKSSAVLPNSVPVSSPPSPLLPHSEQT